jgi:hypothetical protein
MNTALWNPRGARARERTRIAGTTTVIFIYFSVLFYLRQRSAPNFAKIAGRFFKLTATRVAGSVPFYYIIPWMGVSRGGGGDVILLENPPNYI